MKAILLLLICATTAAAQVRLAWDASSSSNVTYRIYGHTNTISSVSDAAVKVETGTNTLGIVNGLSPGRWWFVVTARSSSAESAPSNQVQAEIPEPPTQVRTLWIQWSSTLQTWTNVGFFRLKIE